MRSERRRLLVRLACVGGVLLLPATFPVAAGSFTAATSDTGNSATAATISAPSGLSATQTCTSVAAPVYRAGAGATGTNFLTLATPTEVAAGDVLLAYVSNRDSWPMPTPSGWNLIRRDSNGSQVQAAVYWRVATASEPAEVTFTLTGASNTQIVGGLLAYSGVSTTDLTNAGAVSAGMSTTATTPSVTTTARNTLLVHIIAKRKEALPAPALTTSRSSVFGSGTGSLGAVAVEETFAGPGATTARSSTSPDSFITEWVAHTVALRPPAGTPSASLTWTASPTSTATGYLLERVVGGAVQATATATPISRAATTDGTLVNGTAYTYRLYAYYGTWRSTAASTTLTPAC